MKYYKLTGYIMPKGQEDKGWQKVREGVKVQLPDNVDPYRAIDQTIRTEASEWLFTVDEITEQEMNH